MHSMPNHFVCEAPVLGRICGPDVCSVICVNRSWTVIVSYGLTQSFFFLILSQSDFFPIPHRACTCLLELVRRSRNAVLKMPPSGDFHQPVLAGFGLDYNCDDIIPPKFRPKANVPAHASPHDLPQKAMGIVQKRPTSLHNSNYQLKRNVKVLSPLH